MSQGYTCSIPGKMVNEQVSIFILGMSIFRVTEKDFFLDTTILYRMSLCNQILGSNVSSLSFPSVFQKESICQEPSVRFVIIFYVLPGYSILEICVRRKQGCSKRPAWVSSKFHVEQHTCNWLSPSLRNNPCLFQKLVLILALRGCEVTS